MSKLIFLMILSFTSLSWATTPDLSSEDFKSQTTDQAIQNCSKNGQKNLFHLNSQDSANINMFLNNFTAERKAIILNAVMKKALRMSNNCDELADNAVRIFNAITKTHDQIEEALGIELFD